MNYKAFVDNFPPPEDRGALLEQAKYWGIEVHPLDYSGLSNCIGIYAKVLKAEKEYRKAKRIHVAYLVAYWALALGVMILGIAIT